MGKVKGASKITAIKSNPAKTSKAPAVKDKKISKGKPAKKSPALKLSKASSGIRKSISKKEKQQLKKQIVKRKIELTQAEWKKDKEEDKARLKRKKTAVVGDMRPLLDSLPSLDELLTLRETSKKTGIAAIDRRIPKPPKTKKARRQLQLHDKTEKMLDRFDLVQKIWRNPEFQKNPRQLIAEQIKQRRQARNEMET